MGINTAQNTLIQEVTLPASSAIAAGDLIVLNEGGTTVKASNQLTTAQNNITTAGVSAVAALANRFESNVYTFYANENDIAVLLGNNIIAVAYAGNGSSNANSDVNVSYFTVTGALYQPRTKAEVGSTVGSVKIIKLNESKFVVSWIVNTTLKFAVYTNAGTQVGSTTTVATTASPYGTVRDWQIKRISDTRFVIVYNTSSTARFKIFDDNATIVGTETQFDTGSVGEFNILIHSITGDFWISYIFVTGTLYKLARFNSAGVLQGTIVTVFSGAATAPTNRTANLTELSDGKVVVLVLNGSSFPNMYVYTSALVVSASNTSWHNNDGGTALNYTYPRVVPQANGEFFLFVSTNIPFIRIWRFNNSLNQISIINTGATIGTTVNGQNAGYLYAFVNGSLGFTIITGGFNGTNYGTTLASVNTTNTLIGSSTVLFSTSSSLLGGLAFLTPEGILAFFGGGSATGTAANGFYNTQKKSLFGVAQDTVAAGSNYRAATQGTFQLNSSTIPSSPGFFDNRAVTPPGPKGIIAGTTAILYGME